MAWEWYPGSWNDVADRSFNPAVGCSNESCPERKHCWARRFASRQKPRCAEGWDIEAGYGCNNFMVQGLDYCIEDCRDNAYRGCALCYNFDVHEHFDRYERLRLKANDRVAFAWMGDLGDWKRTDSALEQHIRMAYGHWLRAEDKTSRPTFLIQTRHVEHIIQAIVAATGGRFDGFEIGTTLTCDEDLANVYALAALPPEVVRFVAFEPLSIGDGMILLYVDPWQAILDAKPDWAYIGLPTPRSKHSIENAVNTGAIEIAAALEHLGSKVIYKSSCGPELWQRNSGVVLP